MWVFIPDDVPIFDGAVFVDGEYTIFTLHNHKKDYIQTHTHTYTFTYYTNILTKTCEK